MNIRLVLVSGVLFLFAHSSVLANIAAAALGNPSATAISGTPIYSVPKVMPFGTADAESKPSLKYSSQSRLVSARMQYRNKYSEKTNDV